MPRRIVGRRFLLVNECHTFLLLIGHTLPILGNPAAIIRGRTGVESRLLLAPPGGAYP
jgi:hypothetical protein